MTRIKQIAEHYDICEVDYKYNWHLDECLALHIGYWDETTNNLPEALLRQNEIMKQKSEISGKDLVLDAGCGIGGSCIFLAKDYGCKVVGITLSAKQAISAANFSKIHGTENLTKFLVMDFNNTGFLNESFDVIWALESSCYADSKREFINEAFRLLKKKGRLIVADGFESKHFYSYIEEKILDNWVKRWAVDSLESIKQFHFYLKEVGFINIEFEDITNSVKPSSKKLFYRSLLALPMAKISEFKGIRNKVQNDNILGAIFQYLAMKLNLSKYGVFFAEKP